MWNCSSVCLTGLDTVDGKNTTNGAPSKGWMMIMEFVRICYNKYGVVKHSFSWFPWGPGRFRKLWGVCSSYFQLSWYPFDTLATSYGQKPSGGICLLSTVGLYTLNRWYSCLQRSSYFFAMLCHNSAPWGSLDTLLWQEFRKLQVSSIFSIPSGTSNQLYSPNFSQTCVSTRNRTNQDW